ncbi:tetratricopeptide repeat protein [Bradyrhizobium tropiciagri]|uniref:tetratricopeptide repeat protein n=1 Tax=Bradyrhizobium tropiciagri TaxID=312253 RepID=UPI001BACDF15|nr:tetratricopeptide repeat protein [Bradyrhizobium tropiciagri]MBR0871352.1 tetratricopeptide repeat protein [Bradyrhizobium tropiciagri]
MSNAAISEAQALRAGLSMLNQAPSERRLEFVQTIANRAGELLRQGQPDSAEVLLETIAQEPLVRQRVLHLRGLIALQREEDEQALDLLDEAIRLDPADAEAHANLGALLLKARQYPQALAAYAAALTLQPSNATALLGLARALTVVDLTDFACDTFREIRAIAPDDIRPVVDFASLLNDIDRTDEALVLVRDALARHPEQANLHTMLAVCLFACGDWPAARAEFEWRLKEPQISKHLLATDRPQWNGEDLTGKTILLQFEQGFGDTLQFVRYAPMVKARGGRVMLRAQGPLLPLLRTVTGIDDVFDAEDELPAFDVHAPLLSLPRIFATQNDTVPATVPYIAPDPDLVARWWGERLGTHPGPSVGLVWQGNPAHVHDSRRSLPLDRLRPLLDCPGARFVSLQVGPGQNQLTEFDDGIVDAGAQIDPGSFADAAAIIANLDLVITVDSAIAHLAGAMGKPVWILLAKGSDWRWPRDRDETPWYPHARLFRQAVPGDWAEVIGRLCTALWSFTSAEAARSDEPTKDPVIASALRMAAPRPVSENTVLCDALFVEACRHHRAGNFDRAKRLFEQVLVFDPRHVNTLCNLAALEIEAGEGELALKRLRIAVNLAPNLVPVRIGLAEALLGAGRTEQALGEYGKAIDLAPEQAGVHAAYATALSKLSDPGQAGLDPDARKRLIHEHYRKALELAPRSDALHAQYALALCQLGELDNAMNHFLAATQINQQQSSEFYEALGRVCAARGNAQGAEISLKHAVALDPQRATAHCALGELYLVLDRPDDAASSFRGALTIDTESAAALRGMERVQAPGRIAVINGMS